MGIKLFEKKKEPIEMISTITNIGLMIRNRDSPAERIGVNSVFSPNEPMVIMDESSTPTGRAGATKLAVAYMSNSASTYHSRPFPIRSSRYFQTNCIRKMNRMTNDVTKNGPRYARTIIRCSFLNPLA